MAKRVGENIRYQLYENTRLNDDWGPEEEFPNGKIEPSRNSGAKGSDYFTLGNRASIVCTSINSIQRGLRPKRYVLDDPEYDADGEAADDLTAKTSHFLRVVVKPMLQRPGAGIDWTGTYVTRRHLLYQAMQTEERVRSDGKVVKVSADPLFNRWHRMLVPVASEVHVPAPEGEEPQTKIQSCWPHMWPSDEEERTALGLSDEHPTLKQIEEDVGTPVFLSEYMHKPGEGGAQFFPDPYEDKDGEKAQDKFGWWYGPNTIDESLDVAPWKSHAVVKWVSNGEPKQMPMNAFLRNCSVFCTVDTADTNGPTSDRKVAMVLAYGFNNETFVLDMVSSNAYSHPEFVKRVLLLAVKWRCPTIHPERIKIGVMVESDLRDLIVRGAHLVVDSDFLPAVKGFHPGFTDKQTKISALLTEFEYGKIKFPWDMRLKGGFKRLMEQVRNFNPASKDGGLDKDDEIDCLAMKKYVVRRAPVSEQEEKESRIKKLCDMLRNGQTTDDSGTPIIVTLMAGLPITDVLEAQSAVKDFMLSQSFSDSNKEGSVV